MKLLATALFLVAPACGFDTSGGGGGGTGDGDDAGAVIVDAARPFDAAAPSPDAATGIHLRVEVLMDGRSHLLVRGSTVQWLHLDNAAPGRHAGANAPTVIDGVDWLPVWPDADGDLENRDCGCLSDVYDGLAVALPAASASATVTEIQARGSASIVEEPSAGNNYTLVFEVNDNGLGGSDDYIVEVDTLVIE